MASDISALLERHAPTLGRGRSSSRGRPRNSPGKKAADNQRRRALADWLRNARMLAGFDSVRAAALSARLPERRLAEIEAGGHGQLHGFEVNRLARLYGVEPFELAQRVLNAMDPELYLALDSGLRKPSTALSDRPDPG